MILGFAHAALVVPELERAATFYQEMFGFQVLSRMDWRDTPAVDAAIGLHGSAADSVMLAGHNCYLELFQFHSPPPYEQLKTPRASDTGIRHLAFFVSDLPHEYERLIALGGKKLGEPVANENGRLAVYARDPFGNLIELCEPPDDQEQLSALPGVNGDGNYLG